jgi:acid phosphatase type 7
MSPSRLSRVCTMMAIVCLLVGLASACGGSGGPTAPSPPAGGGNSGVLPPAGPGPGGSPFTPAGQTARVLAVADIGECGSPGVEQTARLVERSDGLVLLAGDLAYYQGSIADFVKCFDPTWGPFRPRWRPVPGNHEYETPGAAGYFQYFGSEAGPGRSYYSFRTGDWFVLMLDSNIAAGVGSPQFQFARSELQASTATCTMAVWHHPLYSSGPNGPSLFMRDMWRLLYDSNVDVVVSGHDHLYERFGKQDADGRSDAGGMRQFVAGTGGAQLYLFQRMSPNSQARISAHGVLRLTLNPTSYEWGFVDVTGATADAGSDSCH